MNTLTQFLEKEKINPRFQIFSNTWLEFIGYIAKRNSGYGQRKTLNIISEVIELSCLAWVMDISFLHSVVLIPIAHICINYIQEFHWQLFRYAPKAWFEKRFNILDQGMFGFTILILIAVAHQLFKRQMDPLLLTLFAMRTIVIFVQMLLAPANARFTSIKRVRPNVQLIWASAMIAWILSLTLRLAPLGIYYAIVIGVIFNGVKLVQEFSFYYSVKKEKHRQRYLPLHPKKDLNDQHIVREAALPALLHIAVMIGFSIRFHLFYSGFAPVITFFFLTFCDRLNSRPFRSLALDFFYLEYKRFSQLKRGILLRLLLISVPLCLFTTTLLSYKRGWPAPAQLSLLVIIFNSMMSNALICSRSIRHAGIKWFIGTQVISVLALILENKSFFFLFLVIQFFGFIFAIFALTRKEDARPNLQRFHFQFDWNPVLPTWHEFIATISCKKISLISIDRKQKILSVDSEQDWQEVLAAFPLNIKNWKKVQVIPTRSPKRTPPNTKIAHLNVWAFWKSEGDSQPGLELSKFLHKTFRDINDYQKINGGKYSWKNSPTEPLQFESGPIDPEGKSQWYR